MWQRLPSGGNRFHWGVVVRDPCICHLGSRLGSCPYRPSGRLRLSATMNLERVSNEEKLNLCRKYYLGGFAFLPFLWLVNIFWFFREAFLVPAYTEQSQIKGYVWRSAVGFLFWVIVLTTWITIFQIYRPRWGALGDYLSFTIPLGTP
ncbi:gamma-secretase subunit pen-2-like [Lynx pardinus]|uniref:Gamma-secretase subunit PEN-2 n=4 Tax=Felinae TaxID=338152 RepID=A0A6I9ZQD5_ACIJB|nr:gamma-secretase subunit PEN-2 isoform X1 [Felis catus]XP_014927495.1 gamma-secretase subunit PEN-2 [Acinonyx jubatus]XP_025770367.1 gamma-secretase subunit PEN-2 [Puma concolor]XP_030155040.1 gamma-secretase subunit PEN-2 isoform X1 [Lynx canadensis]XP_043456698.1 gamma-secretase subunit PEN-2 isoform X1 [Prionailurus bengalensis]XP_045297195.1 gamma-secretase subunit PEN-2 isoform X1 [Leopardus geoffroyi]XP_046934186.1 gamma-secretase subunit PEN-2 [Lynx rufus]XP_047692926.1 gamma-secret